ncbi:MAG: hypothetical protein ACK4GJ_05775, partial [bacterium]
MEKMESLSKYGSKIKFNGIEVTGPLGKKEVKISEGEGKKRAKDYFLEGTLKGLGLLISSDFIIGKIFNNNPPDIPNNPDIPNIDIPDIHNIPNFSENSDSSGSLKLLKLFNPLVKMGLILGVGGIFYPALIGAYKLGEGYIKASKAAKSVGLNNWEATKAGIKGALALGVGEFLHGLFDAIAIGQL